MENLEIYNKVRSVPEEAQKAFNNGSFSGTDINPMWRIKTLTEQFGPCGFGWFVNVIEHWSEEINGEITTNVAINLFVKLNDKWSEPIYGIGGSRSLQQTRNGAKVSDEAYKMAYTDAISVAAKALGVGADIYFEKDKTKYTAEETSAGKTTKAVKATKQEVKPEAKPEEPKPTAQPTIVMVSNALATAVNNCKTVDELKALYKSQNDDVQKNPEFISIVTTRKSQLEVAKS